MSDSSESSASFDLEFLRKDAKRLTRACRAGDSDALARLRQSLPRLVRVDDQVISSNVTLADAQQAIAREHGCVNWAALTRVGAPLEHLLAAVRGGALPAITPSLDTFRALVRESVHAACALGDVDALTQHLDRAPDLAATRHRGWPPVAYVCASPMHRLSGRHSAGLLACATLLLDRGAEADNLTPPDEGNDVPVPVGVRALRSSNHAVMMLLQRRGADPRLAMPHMKGLMQTPQPFGSAISEYYAQPHIREAMQGPGWGGGHFTPLDLRTFHGGGLASAFMDGPEWTVSPFDRFSAGALAVGISHVFPTELVAHLLEQGFDARSTRLDGRTLVAAAVRAGRQEVAELLRAHGAPEDDVRPIDALIGACVRLDADAAHALASSDAASAGALSLADVDLIAAAARAGAVDHLRLMFDVGLPASRPGTAGITALHQAAWQGRVDVVRLLLERGARTGAHDSTYDATPCEWAEHGSVHCRTAAAEYRDVLVQLGGAA